MDQGGSTSQEDAATSAAPAAGLVWGVPVFGGADVQQPQQQVGQLQQAPVSLFDVLYDLHSSLCILVLVIMGVGIRFTTAIPNYVYAFLFLLVWSCFFTFRHHSVRPSLSSEGVLVYKVVEYGPSSNTYHDDLHSSTWHPQQGSPAFIIAQQGLAEKCTYSFQCRGWNCLAGPLSRRL